MGIIEAIRTKFGSDIADSEALEKALADVTGKINANETAILALEHDLPAAVLKSIDSGATERRKLTALKSERDGLLATDAALRKEIAAARAAKQSAAHLD